MRGTVVFGIRVVVGHFIVITIACVDVIVVVLRTIVVLIIAVIANMCAVVIGGVSLVD